MSLDLEAIKARAEAATPGPWEFDAELFTPSDPAIGRYWVWVWEVGAGPDLVLGGASGEDDPSPDLVFLCAARTDVPALVAEVEELRSIVRRFATNRGVYDSYICFQCQSLTNADGTMDEPHSDDCPYAAAVRWVEANPA